MLTVDVAQDPPAPPQDPDSQHPSSARRHVWSRRAATIIPSSLHAVEEEGDWRSGPATLVPPSLEASASSPLAVTMSPPALVRGDDPPGAPSGDTLRAPTLPEGLEGED